MKSKFYFLLAFFLLAAAMVFLFWGDGEADSASPDDASAARGRMSLSERSPRSGRREVSGGRHPGESDEDRKLREGQLREAQDQLVGGMVKTASLGFAKTRKELGAEFALSEAQTAALGEIFERRAEELAGLLSGSDQPFPGNERETLEKICALIRQKGLRDELVEFLSEEQLETFDRREKKRVQARLEARTYRDLAKVNEVVELSDDQKQEVFDALMKGAPERVEEEANARAFMSLTYGPLAAEMDSSVVAGMAGMMKTEADGPPDFQFGNGDHEKWLEERKAGRVERELAALAEVLDPEQLSRYREHLEAQSPW